MKTYVISKILGLPNGMGEAIGIIILLFLPIVIGKSLNTVITKYYMLHRYNVKSIEYTGKDIIQKYIYNNNMSTQIRLVKGCLTDYYNPETDYIYLSEATYNHRSLMSVVVALHEFSHAILFKKKEPSHVVSIILGNWMVWFARFMIVFMFLHIVLDNPPLVISITAFVFTVLYIVTGLCIISREMKANVNALNILKEYVDKEDTKKCKVLLRMCVGTYIASFISTISITIFVLIGSANKYKNK